MRKEEAILWCLCEILVLTDLSSPLPLLPSLKSSFLNQVGRAWYSGENPDN
jgi:hypothetical protein